MADCFIDRAWGTPIIIKLWTKDKRNTILYAYRIHINWRPISLLNVIYKLMSSVIANRLKLVLDKLISNKQKGFISGRYIGENIRMIYETQQQNIPALLVSIDFQQAFDKVSWKFIDKTLDYFNFGPSIKNE